MTGETQHWYRLEIRRYAAPCDEFERPIGEGVKEVHMLQLEVLKVTPKGVWLNAPHGRRFVLRDAHKRYACPTLEEARESFAARQRRRIRILLANAAEAQWAIDALKPDYCRITRNYTATLARLEGALKA